MRFLTYNGTADLIAQTKRAITGGLGAGFKRDMMAIVTYRGREHSSLTPYDKLGAYLLRAFGGEYDLFGNPVVLLRRYPHRLDLPLQGPVGTLHHLDGD